METAEIARRDEGTDDPGAGLVYGWLAGKRSQETRDAYLRDITAWLHWLADHGIAPLGADEPAVAAYARHLDAIGYAASTAARKLSAVSSWYTWLVRNGHMGINPAAPVDRPEVDRDRSTTPGLTKDEALTMLKAADNARGPQQLRTSALIALMLFTGARVSEVTGADIEDLGTDRGHRVLWVTRKGGKRQPLGLPPPVTDRVDTYLASRPDMEHLPAVSGDTGNRDRRPLFATEPGNRLPLTYVKWLIRRLGKTAGLPGDLARRMSPHAMRHAFATLYLDAGGNLRDLQDAMGHADPRTTRRYDRARYTLDRSPGYLLASYLAAAEDDA